MIILKIANSSELISSRLGNFVENLTPDVIDDALVEDLVIKKMLENLEKEGIKGEICQVNGLNLQEDKLLVDEGFRITKKKIF